MDKKEKKEGKDKTGKKDKKEKKDKKDKKEKKQKKQQQDELSIDADDPKAAAKLPVEEDSQAKASQQDKDMEEALFGGVPSGDEEEPDKASLPAKAQDNTEALVAEVEQEVRREKASKKEKKDKKDKHKKDKKSKKDKKQRKEVKPASPAFIDETDKIVEHDELNLNAPDKDAGEEEEDIFQKLLLDGGDMDDRLSEAAPSSVRGGALSPAGTSLAGGRSPSRSRLHGRSLSPSPLPGKRRRSQSIREEEAEPQTLSSQWAQVMEAIKPRKGLIIKDEEAHVFVDAFVKKMEGVAAQDVEEYLQGKPMVNKLKMLPEAVEVMEKFQFSDAFVAYGGCKAIALWLQNLPNGQLPSVHIRSTLLTCMERLPITKDALKDAGEPRLGQIVAKLQTHPDETPLNRKRARGLVQKWLRQIMIPEEADTLEGFLAEGEKVGAIPRPPPETEESLALQEQESAKRLHPAIPVIQGKEYVIQPISTAQPIVREKMSTDTYKGKLNEVLKVMARPNKRSWKPYSVSIAGRQLNAD